MEETIIAIPVTAASQKYCKDKLHGVIVMSTLPISFCRYAAMPAVIDVLAKYDTMKASSTPTSAIY